MTELEKRKGPSKSAVTIAVAVVMVAAIAACLVISLTIINEIPFHHIFPAGYLHLRIQLVF